MDRFEDARAVLAALKPDVPVLLNRPHRARAAARLFGQAFAGETLYAVKANPAPWLLQALWDEGVRLFDVASEAECRLVRGLLPEAGLAFMHPVKGREAIRRTWHEFGCRVFALDSVDELQKILDETDGARDLSLIVRLAVPNPDARLKLESKFGVAGDAAADLLRRARAATSGALGVAFHVGSQCDRPGAWGEAMRVAGDLVVRAGVTVDIVDVGGGFPALYPGMNPPALEACFEAIERAFEAMPVTMNCRLWAEPGRALAADSASLLTRVELRKGNSLYLNDGAYGRLFDATHVRWTYPMRALGRPGGAAPQGALEPFGFYGPTCDSLDAAEGPFFLPADIAEGDWIEIGMLGAYGQAMATGFNGYGAALDVEVADSPWPSLIDACPTRQPGQWRTGSGRAG